MSSPGDALAQLQAADKRIAELEAKWDRLVCEKVDLGAKVVGLEAELASVRDGLPESVKRGKWVAYCRNQFKAYDRAFRSEQEQRARAERAEAEVEALRGGQKALLIKLRKAEAELETRAGREPWKTRCFQEKRERERAEAEVERLTNILRDILKHVGLCHDSSDSNLNSFYAWVDDTLGGGGRDSGGEKDDEGGRTGEPTGRLCGGTDGQGVEGTRTELRGRDNRGVSAEGARVTAANPAAPGTSGEASPTRVASPPHDLQALEQQINDDRRLGKTTYFREALLAAYRKDAAAPQCTCAFILGNGPCPQHGWAAARKERDG